MHNKNMALDLTQKFHFILLDANEKQNFHSLNLIERKVSKKLILIFHTLNLSAKSYFSIKIHPQLEHENSREELTPCGNPAGAGQGLSSYIT